MDLLKILKKEYEDKIENILPLLEEMNVLRRKIFWDFETTSFFKKLNKEERKSSY